MKIFHEGDRGKAFCADCGTPLTYEAPDGIAIAAGAFDDPSALPPVPYPQVPSPDFPSWAGRGAEMEPAAASCRNTRPRSLQIHSDT